VRLDDQITISTPEGVDVEITLAGLGSRAIAGLLDLTIEAFVVIGLLLLFGVFGGGSSGFVTAGFIVVIFLVLFGYFVLFEVLNNGRTPGKAANGLRVLRNDGGRVSFVASAVRNILRLVDGWDILTLFLCPIGTISVLATRENQRLGDLAAGTVVVRERFVRTGNVVARPMPMFDPTGLGWDVSAITPDELVTVRRFLERRTSLAPNARIHLADELAMRLRPKVVGPNTSGPSEWFLEAVAAIKTGRA
jgi:uncharacterized RDD family membrane protein YckC